MRDRYDYIVIDAPPSLGLLTVNGLTAADSVIVPIQCEYYALEGLSQLVSTIAMVQEHLNPTLEWEGVVMTMYDVRTNLSQQVIEDVKTYFQNTVRVYDSIIPAMCAWARRRVSASPSPCMIPRARAQRPMPSLPRRS